MWFWEFLLLKILCDKKKISYVMTSFFQIFYVIWNKMWNGVPPVIESELVCDEEKTVCDDEVDPLF